MLLAFIRRGTRTRLGGSRYTMTSKRIDCDVLDTPGERQAHAGTFGGQWAPTFLILGVYNKLVKQLGSDRTSRA